MDGPYSARFPSSPTGEMVLEFQMVKEQEFWFSTFADVNVTVTSGPPPPPPSGGLTAAYRTKLVGELTALIAEINAQP